MEAIGGNSGGEGRRVRFISLFSGAGGFDLGFDRAGMTCLSQVEINPQAIAVLSQYWSNVKRFKDVRDVGKHNLPAADLICGGFPCQDVSLAGERKGLAGERSGLWFEYLRVIQELKPRWIVVENVPGLLSSNQGRDFATVLYGLVECGYGIVWRVLDAQYWGVPQRRERLFIVGCLDKGRAAEVLFEREGLSGDIDTRQSPQETITPTNGGDSRRASGIISGSSIEVFDARGNGLGAVVPTLVGSHLNRVTDYTPIVIDPENGARRLTPIEVERLQSFPDDFTNVSKLSDTARYDRMGNAVTVNVAEWIGRRIIAANQKGLK